TASHWRLALKYYASPGFMDETMAVYLARGLRRGGAQPEEDEIIRKRFFALSDIVQRIDTGKIQDGKTIAAVLWLAALGPLQTQVFSIMHSIDTVHNPHENCDLSRHVS